LQHNRPPLDRPGTADPQVGRSYCYGIRSERGLCEEVDLYLAYRWFCRLELVGKPQRLSADTRIWIGGDPRLDFGGEEDRAACTRMGQERAQRWDLQSIRFHHRSGLEHPYLPRRQNSAAVPSAIHHVAERRHKEQHEALPAILTESLCALS
jgi:hypothetical protein